MCVRIARVWRIMRFVLRLDVVLEIGRDFEQCRFVVRPDWFVLGLEEISMCLAPELCLLYNDKLARGLSEARGQQEEKYNNNGASQAPKNDTSASLVHTD